MKRNLLLLTLFLSVYAFSQLPGHDPASKKWSASPLDNNTEDAYVVIANLTTNSASVMDILSNPRLVVLPQPKDPKDAIHLHSFIMTIISKSGKKVFETTYGYRFTGEQINEIKTLSKGDVIVIDGINGKKLSESLRNFPSIRLTIQ
jgi:hypothetical protein